MTKATQCQSSAGGIGSCLRHQRHIAGSVAVRRRGLKEGCSFCTAASMTCARAKFPHTGAAVVLLLFQGGKETWRQRVTGQHCRVIKLAEGLQQQERGSEKCRLQVKQETEARNHPTQP